MRCKIFSLRPMIKYLLKKQSTTSYFHVFISKYICLFERQNDRER